MKNYRKFIKENNIITQFLNKLSDDIENLFLKIKNRIEEETERKISKFEEQLIKLGVVYDMVRSIEKYLDSNDKLVSVRSYISPKNNLQIDSIIKRDKETYFFNTEVIYAGGYNIQKLHYRYLIKTNLPKTNNNEISKDIKGKINNLKKIDKLQITLKSLEIKMKMKEDELKSNMSKSDDDIWKEINFNWPTWEVIVSRGADKNYNYSEDYYNQKLETAKKHDYNKWFKFNIDWVKEDIKTIQKNINKTKLQIQKINNVV